LTVSALVAFSAAPAAGQVQSASAGGWTAPLTSWGDPDLQAQWNSQTSIPLERPLEGPLSGSDTLTLEEAASLEAANRARYDDAPQEGNPGTYNAFWRDFGNAVPRTSLIIDPPDGRIPPLTPEGQARIDAERAERSTRGPSDSPDTYSDLSNWTRCISRGWNGIGSWYSSNYQIFQNPGYVVVFQELIHEARIIPLDRHPHANESIRLWMGDSRGHWEGNTLVVETTNFHRMQDFRGIPPTDDLKVIERFSRVDEETILYEFTIDDPTTYTEVWGGQIPMRATQDLVYEYACHEGNYALSNILRGARYQERMEAQDQPR